MTPPRNSSSEPDNAHLNATIIAQVYEHARAIARGKVLSYGALGALCDPPISGYICGRIMNGAMDDVPWWRVVAKDGSLPIAKRNPILAREQREKLESEGVQFEKSGKVTMAEFAAS